MQNVGNRVQQLLDQMTLKEKVALLSGLDAWHTVPIHRLGIPSLTMTDGPHGVRATHPENGRSYGPTTAFPPGVGMASTWDPDLIEEVGNALGEETRGMGCDILLGPCVNIVRHPLAGRNFESYSEDPYLAGQIGAAWVKGVQAQGIGTSLKHFALNNQEIERNRSSSEVDERTLREIYLAQFEAVVKEAQPWTVMCSYNRINGVYASQNNYLLNEILRNEWGFDGVVVSDWGANHTIVESIEGGLDLEMPGPAKYYGRLLREAVENWQIDPAAVDRAAARMLRLVLRSGKMDKAYQAADGRVNTPEHQALARRVAEESITLLKNKGNILPILLDQVKSIAVIGPNAGEMAITGGGSAMVLPPYRSEPLEALKALLPDNIEICYEPGCDNFNELPAIRPSHIYDVNTGARGLHAEYFTSTDLTQAPDKERGERRADFWWFGDEPVASDQFAARLTGRLELAYSGPYTFEVENTALTRLYLNDQLVLESDPGTQPQAWAANKSAQIILDQAQTYDLRVEFIKKNEKRFAHLKMMFAYKPDPRADDRMERAVEAARKADMAIVFVGHQEGYESEGTDRPDMVLPGKQNELVEAVAKENPRTVVVLNVGAPVSMPWSPVVSAILHVYYPGMEGGSALARVLVGEVNPSGKLTVTYPHRLEDTPAYGQASVRGERKVLYGEGIFVGYRHYDARKIQPLFPFGHGLSYTEFSFRDLKVANKIKPGESVEISVTVKNVGPRTGKEVVQVYLSNPGASRPRPPKELKAFAKINLAPGKSQTVQFTLEPRALAYYRAEENRWIAEPGLYEVLVGSSSKNICLSTVFSLEKVWAGFAGHT